MPTNANSQWVRDPDFSKAPLDAIDEYIPDGATGIFAILGIDESVQFIFGSNDIKEAIRAILDDMRIRDAMKASTDVCYKFTKPGADTERTIEVDRLRRRFCPSAQSEFEDRWRPL